VAIFVMAIAAVEAAIGLGIVITLFRNRQSVNTADFRTMWG
jgi:NADH-quinone oxidoreductase subunit K